MASLDSRFTPALIAEVNAAIENGNKTGARVEAWERVAEKLKESGLMWRSQVPPEMVGVHPGNRCGLGVGGAESIA